MKTLYQIDKLPNKKLQRVIFSDKLYKFPDLKQISSKEAKLQIDYEMIFIYGIAEKYRVTVKAGIVFDGFSVDFLWFPRLFQGRFTGAVCAALFHDIVCRTHICGNRKKTDIAFRIILRDFGYCRALYIGEYIGVRLGSWKSYYRKKQELAYYRKYITIERLA